MVKVQVSFQMPFGKRSVMIIQESDLYSDDHFGSHLFSNESAVKSETLVCCARLCRTRFALSFTTSPQAISPIFSRGQIPLYIIP